MKRLFSILCLTALLAGALAGCGGNDNTGASSTHYVGSGTAASQTGSRGRVADDVYAEDGRGDDSSQAVTDSDGAAGYYDYTAIDGDPFRRDRTADGDRADGETADGSGRLTLLTRVRSAGEAE